jgi:hypothetical protein
LADAPGRGRRSLTILQAFANVLQAFANVLEDKLWFSMVLSGEAASPSVAEGKHRAKLRWLFRRVETKLIWPTVE